MEKVVSEWFLVFVGVIMFDVQEDNYKTCLVMLEEFKHGF